MKGITDDNLRMCSTTLSDEERKTYILFVFEMIQRINNEKLILLYYELQDMML